MAEADDLVSKPPCSREDALGVLLRLREAGHVAYFAGGCVRDLLLGIEPKDWDVATDAPPKRVRELFPATQAVGAAFGVILVRQGRSVVEVATFRAEEKYLDGRRPSAVRFTNAEEDAKRRDFTINGLFLDPAEDHVIDYVGGQADLRAKIVRAIGNPAERFEEDHLRLLRAVRFAARLGFEVEPNTAGAIRTHAPTLKRISPERVADELRRMLTPPSRDRAWLLLWDFALADVIFRFLPPAEAAEFRAERSLFLALSPGKFVPFGLALAAATLCFRWQSAGCAAEIRPLLGRAEAQAAVRAMRQALKISNEESDQVQGTLEDLAPLLADEPPAVARMKRFLAQPTAPLSRQLLEALAARGLHADRIDWLASRLEELEGTDVAPPPLITGDDLAAAGLEPGPLFRKILDSVYDAQLEGRASTQREALDLALRLAGRGNSASEG